MIIQPIKELYGKEGNRITANKARISKIKNNIGDKVYLSCKFDELSENLEICDLDGVQNILMNELFYEFVNLTYVRSLHTTYSNSSDKGSFINSLKESYMLRGVKSIKHAWTPIINRCN